MEKLMNIAFGLINRWDEEYREYFRLQSEFEKTSKWRRFWGHLKEPKHPTFHSLTLINDPINCWVVELRCYDGLFLAVREGNHGYKIELQGGEKSPLLGSRGMYLEDPDFINLVNDIADQIHCLAYPETINPYDEEFLRNLYL